MDTATAGRSAAKRMVTVLFSVVAVWLASLAVGTAAALADNCAATADNCLVGTESFESAGGLPPGWKFAEWVHGTSTATIASGAAADGTHFLRIVSPKPNHARVVVPIPVNPNRSYRFQAMVRARDANPNMAAVLGVDGKYTVTNSVRTDTQWQPLDLYVKVGPQTTLNLTMGLGHYGQLNVGSADFDAVTMTQVQAIPGGATVADLAVAPPTQAQPETAAESSAKQGPNGAIWVFVGILVVVGIGAAVFLMRRGDAESTPETDTKPAAEAESEPAGSEQTGDTASRAELAHRHGPGNQT